MNDLIVIMGSSQPRNGLMDSYLYQLDEAGIDRHIHAIAQFTNTLRFQIQEQRRLVQQFAHYERIVFTDAWDVVFFGSKQDVIAKVPISGVLMAAERNCFPEQALATLMPGRTAWRFVNGGMLCGSPTWILEWFTALERHPLYNVCRDSANQRMFNRLRLQSSPLMVIDDCTHLFYCMHLEKEELQFENGLPVNTVLGTRPNFLHFNGSWPSNEILARRFAEK